jgi:hypothetical protein
MKAAFFIWVLLLPSLIFAQSSTITITDNNGNRTTGTISNGSVFFSR